MSGDSADPQAKRGGPRNVTPIRREPVGAESSGQEKEVIPSPGNPMAVARHYVEVGNWTSGEMLTLRAWRGSWMQWRGSHWTEVPLEEIEEQLYLLTEHAHFRDDKEVVKDWAPTPAKVSNLVAALRAVTLLRAGVSPPAWIGPRQTPAGTEIPDGRFISCANGLLHLDSLALYPHTPAHFNVAHVPFSYDPDAPRPTAWLAFLGALWPGEPEYVTALQEVFGTVISGDTSLQKIFMIVGLPRGGKGTIAAVLTELVGSANVASPTLGSLTDQFGRADLIGKPLAIVADARIGARDSSAAVEHLLSISGEDTQTVQRKYLPDWVGRLPTQFLIMSNGMPKLSDSTGAIVSRLILFVLKRSWLGKEDRGLKGRLLGELPGIFLWALTGLARVRGNGRITEPEASSQALAALRDSIAPMQAFVRDRLRTDDLSAMAVIDDVWLAWQQWCEAQSRQSGSKNHLGRELRDVIPGLVEYMPGPSTKDLLPDGRPDRRRRYRGIQIVTCACPNGRHGSHADDCSHM